MNPFFVLFVGWLLVLLEFYVPGAVMGIAGTVLILSSVFLFSVQSHSPLEIFLFAVLAITGVFGVIKFALWQIPRTRKKESLYLDTDQEGFRAASFPPEAIGKRGTALTDLKPGGYVTIEGKKYPASSVSGYIQKGQEILVISGQEERLNVKFIKKDSSS